MPKRVKRVVYNISVGKPDVKPDAPSHVKGVRQGNQPGAKDKEAGIHHLHNNKAVADSRRSTGIVPESSNPIDSSMPNLTPA